MGSPAPVAGKATLGTKGVPTSVTGGEATVDQLLPPSVDLTSVDEFAQSPTACVVT